ncbi:MAG: sugar O-acetyltransferase [Oscillospiraceae bacterium]|nr:sugar O-acetyltransferase [Oscillospiraceae bacterium]
MTEREKMLAGRLYDPSDRELACLREKAFRLVGQFNGLDKTENGPQRDILRQLLGGMGEHVTFRAAVRFDYGCNTYVGDNCYFNFNAVFLDCAEIRIGSNVMVGPGVSFFTALHPLLAEERNARTDGNGRRYNLEYARPITVEDSVWLGGGVIVNGGVTIGRGAVIGSGSVVTRDIPPGVVAAGVPCRVIRPITEADRMEG